MAMTWRFLCGGLIGLMFAVGLLAAPVPFALAEELGFGTREAGTIAGAMLARMDWAALLVSLALIGLTLARRGELGSRRVGALTLLLAGVVVLTLTEMVAVAPAIGALREEAAMLYGSVGAAPEEFKGRFGMLHGLSVLRAGVSWCLLTASFFVEGRGQR
ncbi:MAG: DUF4149 domain-containing protein [Sumerlaeia bacterium]